MDPAPQKMLSPSPDLLLDPKHWNQTFFGGGTKFLQHMMLDQEHLILILIFRYHNKPFLFTYTKDVIILLFLFTLELPLLTTKQLLIKTKRSNFNYKFITRKRSTFKCKTSISYRAETPNKKHTNHFIRLR